jgi:hypothetical protein
MDANVVRERTYSGSEYVLLLILWLSDTLFSNGALGLSSPVI